MVSGVRDLAFDGSGYALDGASSHQCLAVGSSSTVTINDWTLRNCFVACSAAGVDCGGGALVITGSSQVTLSRVLIESAQAAFSGSLYCAVGGGQLCGGGAIMVLDSALTMVGGAISGASSVGGFGGGVYVAGGAVASLVGANVTGCSASDNPNTGADPTCGGGIYIGGGARLNATEGTKVDGNDATQGGGVCMVGDGATLFDSPGARFEGARVEGNTASGGGSTGYGGGFFVTGISYLLATGTTVADNVAVNGGGLYVQPPSGQTALSQDVSIGSGSAFLGNTAYSFGNEVGQCYHWQLLAQIRSRITFCSPL